jgi:prevent-host-death family protein
MQRRVGIRELKARLSECMRDVKAGRTIEVTEHGRSIGRIVPVGVSLERHLEALRESGQLLWSGRKLRRAKPVARLRGPRTVADLIVEDRE